MKKTFLAYLEESISISNFNRAIQLIESYLSRKAKLKIFFNEIEEFRNKNESGVGVRFMIVPGARSIRFNWNAGKSGSNDLMSVDFWDGKGKSWNIKFNQDESLVKVLPYIVSIIRSKMLRPVRGFAVLTEDIEETVPFVLNESVDADDLFDSVVSMILSPNFTAAKIWSTWKSAGAKIFGELQRELPDLLTKEGRKFSWNGSESGAEMFALKEKVLNQVGTIRGTIRSGPDTSERIATDSKVQDIERNSERLVFEKQIEDLQNLVKMTISGASNALFVAGRGGVGKTHNVEATLAAAGLQDGKGYYKNTGSASAAGIYGLLFKHRDGIILFDDSDDALKDQTSRNLFKAATDTKKIRKLAWTRGGFNIVDPADYDSPDELIDAGKLPAFFEFTGKIIFISNLSINKLDPDGAIRTRAFMIDIDPTEMEVYDFMGKIVDKMPLQDGLELPQDERVKIVELLRKSKSKQSANFRKLSRALNMAAGAHRSGVAISDNELTRMIELYA